MPLKRVVLKRTISIFIKWPLDIMFSQNNIVFSCGSLVSEECYNLKWMVVHTAVGAYRCLDSMYEMPVHCRVTPSIKFSTAHVYNWVKRSITRVLGSVCPRAQCNDPCQGSNLDSNLESSMLTIRLPWLIQLQWKLP